MTKFEQDRLKWLITQAEKQLPVYLNQADARLFKLVELNLLVKSAKERKPNEEADLLHKERN